MPRSPFVVKNGSRQRRRVSSSMPTPESTTSSCTVSAELRVRTVSVPPSGIASTALKMRLVSASRISLSCPRMAASGCCSSVRMAIAIPRCCGRSRQRTRVRSITCATIGFRSICVSADWPVLRPVELAHALHGLADVGDRAPDDVQIAARAIRQAAFVLQQRIRVQRDGRDRVVDVVRDTARHLAERTQAFLLHHCLLALPQVVVRLLQSRVELRLMCGERDVIAQLSQELALVAGERSRFLASDDQHTEHGALRKQRRDHQRAQPRVDETSREVAVGLSDVRLVDQLTFHARRQSIAVDGDAFVLRHRQLLRDGVAA